MSEMQQQNQDCIIEYKHQHVFPELLTVAYLSSWLLFLFNCVKTAESLQRQFTLNHLVPRSSWYTSDWPRKDGILNRLRSYLVLLFEKTKKKVYSFVLQELIFIHSGLILALIPAVHWYVRPSLLQLINSY